MLTSKEKQLVLASYLGTLAFFTGKKASPCLDGDCMAMLTGRDVGVTPEGEASTKDILDVWARAWHSANTASGETDRNAKPV